jgi:hypothetical protein
MDKTDNLRHSSYKKLKHVFEKSHKDNMKILLGASMAKLAGQTLLN